MNKIICAYLAGAIDSDGTIGIKKSTYSMRVTKDSSGATYSERLALRQVTPAIPELLKKHFGGALYMTKPSNENGKHLYSWQITDQKAVACIKVLLPYLRVKKRQALNCLELRKIKERSKKHRIRNNRGHIGAAKRSQKNTDAMDDCYLKAKSLNKIGA